MSTFLYYSQFGRFPFGLYLMVAAAYPNPFNATTTIRVSLPHSSEINVSVYNTLVRKINTLATGTYPAGQHRFTLDSRDLASGLYFNRTSIPGEIEQVQKIVLLR